MNQAVVASTSYRYHPDVVEKGLAAGWFRGFFGTRVENPDREGNAGELPG